MAWSSIKERYSGPSADGPIWRRLKKLLGSESFYKIFSRFKAFVKSDLLYDQETQGSGLYLPELEEPEHCNAQNTCLWEYHLLRVSEIRVRPGLVESRLFGAGCQHSHV